MKRKDFLQATSTALIGGAWALGTPLHVHAKSTKSIQSLLPHVDPGTYDDTWWNREPVRLIQTNLREIDANLDRDSYVQTMLDASVNLVLLNVGGIVANYPTQLPYHFRNPLMEGDLVGDLIEKLHENDIRVMGRFDFSRLNEQLAKEKPEWLYVSSEGHIINYNGQVHTCPSAGYQQEYVFEILNEALGLFPLDAIFFNMIGYQTWDYSGVNHGICQCESCKRLFYDKTGHPLPRSSDMRGLEDEHEAFTRSTSLDLFQRIHHFIREKSADIVINTYTDEGVDMITTESASSLATGYDWNYDATDSVKRVLNSYSDLVPNNLLIQFMALQYRHIAISPHLAQVWQLQNMLHGGSLNFVVIGPKEEYQDRVFFPKLKEIYGFHKQHESLFTNLGSVNQIALIRDSNLWESNDETRGLIKLLSENHLMYDVLMPEAITSGRAPRPVNEYDTIIVGDVRELSEEAVNRLDAYVQNGGNLLVTGFSGTDERVSEGKQPPPFRSLGLKQEAELYPLKHSTYLTISEEDKAFLGEEYFKHTDLMMMYTDFLKIHPAEGTHSTFRLMPVSMYGPPEKNYYTEDEVTDWPGMTSNSYGRGRAVYLPWKLGQLYYFKGHHAHRNLFLSLIQHRLQTKTHLSVEASHLLEISHMVNRNKAFEWVGMINHTGQMGATFGEHVPLKDIRVRIKPQKPIRNAYLLRSEKAVEGFSEGDGWMRFEVPEVCDFEMLVCVYS
ncbi:beta-galactosidase trimerization domain-containing protein [Balneolaceae bacterium ANBcel3]|nr:beta-galactosidase trimerization domain-containing protein [Balneolaceae bacterium ANBcel3]